MRTSACSKARSAPFRAVCWSRPIMSRRRGASSPRRGLPPSCGMLEPGAAIAEDAFLGGRIRLRQPRRGHPAGTDAVLLAALAAPREGETVYDLGAGVGAVGLIVAARTKARVVFVEREPVLAALCRENIALNRLDARARVIEADLLPPAAA